MPNRFDSCLDYSGMVSTIQQIQKEVQYSQVGHKVGSIPMEGHGGG
jgi:hypothetical protein